MHENELPYEHASSQPGPSYLLTAADALFIGRGWELEVSNLDGGRATLRLPAGAVDAGDHRPSTGRGAVSPVGELALTEAEMLAGQEALRAALPAPRIDVPTLGERPWVTSRVAHLTRERIFRLCRGEVVAVPTTDGTAVLSLRLPSLEEARDLSRGRDHRLHWLMARGPYGDGSLNDLALAAATRIELLHLGMPLESPGAAVTTSSPASAGLYEAVELAGRARQPAVAALIATAALRTWPGHDAAEHRLRASLTEIAAASSPEAVRRAADRCLGAWNRPLLQTPGSVQRRGGLPSGQRTGLS